MTKRRNKDNEQNLPAVEKIGGRLIKKELLFFRSFLIEIGDIPSSRGVELEEVGVTIDFIGIEGTWTRWEGIGGFEDGEVSADEGWCNWEFDLQEETMLDVRFFFLDCFRFVLLTLKLQINFFH